MNFYKNKLLFTIFIGITITDSYKILGIFPLNSKSHNNMFEAILKGLAKHGHKVDVITHFKLKNPPKNYNTIINLNGTLKPVVNTVSIDKAFEVKENPLSFIATRHGNGLCELMSLKEMQQFIKNPPDDYDLVITEAFTSNCYFGFGFILKVPVVIVSTLATEFPWYSNVIGNPISTAFATNVFLDMVAPTTFFDRLQSTLVFYQNKYTFEKITEQPQTDAMRKYLSPDIPNIREIEKSVSLMFINSHHTLFPIRPITTAVFPIGGIHIEENDDVISPELKKWMDESIHGVIYFNVGSMMLIESLPRDTLLNFYASFAKVAPIKVLMKIVDKNKLPPGLPQNVLTSSWIPQIPVLRHKNTKVFITHGGLMGLQEAIYHGVLIIGFPFYIDQLSNIEFCVKKKIGIRLDIKTVTVTKLNNALNFILNDKSYKKAILRESRLFRDRPMSAINTTNFWVEYVIRNGANSLRSPAIDLYWWQVQLLDVYAFLVFAFISLMSLIFFSVKKIIDMMFIKSKKLAVVSNKKRN